MHQGLLQRPRLTRLEHAHVLLCLGLDYKRGGFVDRALEAFNEVLRLDPKNEYALVNLQKLHEEQHQWTEAYDTRRRLSTLAKNDEPSHNQAILAFLDNEIGLEAMRRKDYPEAIRRFDSAIDLDARAVPAYLNLGDRPGRSGQGSGGRRHLGETGRSRARSRVSRVRPTRSARRPQRLARAFHARLPAADRRQPAGLAGASGAVAPPGRERPRPRCARPPVCRAGPESARAQHPSGDLARLRAAPVPRRARQPLQRADAPCGLLSRPARLHALPLPQHRTAVAMPALPRLEHLRGGANRAGAGHDGCRGLNLDKS